MDLPNDKQEQCVHSENNANCKIVIAYKKWTCGSELSTPRGILVWGLPPLQNVKQDLTCK